jgi:nucleoside-diphosphate-sugar epimerase
MNILISGINGYLGNLVFINLKKIYSNANFYGLSSKEKPSLGYFLFNDIKVIPKNINFDLVFYFSWQGVNGDDKFNEKIQKNNYLNGLSFYKRIKKQSKMIFFFGSIAEFLIPIYGKNNDLLYGYYKNKLHKSIQNESKGLNNYVWLQLANVFGPKNITENILGKIIRAYSTKITFQLNTKCSTLYDFIYEEDLVKILMILTKIKKLPSKIYIGSGKPKPLNKYINTINFFFSFEKNTSLNLNKEDKYQYSKDNFNNNVLSNLLGKNFNFISFEKALTNTMEALEYDSGFNRI